MSEQLEERTAEEILDFQDVGFVNYKNIFFPYIHEGRRKESVVEEIAKHFLKKGKPFARQEALTAIGAQNLTFRKLRFMGVPLAVPCVKRQEGYGPCTLYGEDLKLATLFLEGWEATTLSGAPSSFSFVQNKKVLFDSEGKVIDSEREARDIVDFELRGVLRMKWNKGKQPEKAELTTESHLVLSYLITSREPHRDYTSEYMESVRIPFRFIENPNFRNVRSLWADAGGQVFEIREETVRSGKRETRRSQKVEISYGDLENVSPHLDLRRDMGELSIKIDSERLREFLQESTGEIDIRDLALLAMFPYMPGNARRIDTARTLDKIKPYLSEREFNPEDFIGFQLIEFSRL